MRLAPLEPEDAELARQWRNERLDALRTPYPLTYEAQQRWYSNRKGRWWAVKDGRHTIGYGGIQNIQWESSIGEISLLIGPQYQGKGNGAAALHLMLREAFATLGLKTVYGECYRCNPAVDWWEKQVCKLRSYRTTLPNRKYYYGRYWDSLYFSIDRDAIMEDV